MDIAERAYAAGLFDGEGCVQVYLQGKGRTQLLIALSVSGTDFRPLEWLQERWGGRIQVYDEGTGPRSDGSSRRPLGTWRVRSHRARDFANDIYPFLVVKRDQLELWFEALDLTRQRGGRQLALTEEERAAREDVASRVKELKRS